MLGCTPVSESFVHSSTDIFLILLCVGHFPKPWPWRDSNMARAQGAKGTGLNQVLWGLKILKFRVFFKRENTK